MELSQFQKDILEWAAVGTGNAVVDAKAGSGKTFTLVELLKVIKGKVIFLAFNKHIAEELQRKAPMHVQVSTTNAYGNMIVRSSMRGVKFDKFKTWNIFQNLTDRNTYMHARNQVMQVVSLLKAGYNGQQFEDVETLIDRHNIVFHKSINNPIDLCNKTFKKVVDSDGFIDFDDQIFYPVYKNLPIYEWDWVCVDELQDLNPVQAVLIERMCGKKGRFIGVGDPRQSVYSFRGADIESVPNIIKRFNAKVLPLNVCYRCPRLVIEKAQEIVPEITWCGTTGDGKVESIPVVKWEPEPNDIVLCRTTAPLVSECLRLIRMGKKAIVKGRDIGEGLSKLFDQVVGQAGSFLAPDQLIQMFEQYRQLQMQVLRDKPDSLKVVVNDQIDTLIALVEYADEEAIKGTATTVDQVINSLFSDTSTVDSVLFCSIHRSKGLEFKRVHIIRPDLLPHPKCLDGWQLIQEKNLEYVAITRSLEQLYFVTGERKNA